MIVKRLIALAGLVALLLPGLAHADIFEKVGTFGGQFLKISVGARGAGMGGAYVAMADEASAVFWNAAGIARIDNEKSQLSLNHANWPAELSFDQFGYVFTMQPMEVTTAFQPTGTGETFDAGMLAAGITYARLFTDKFSAGLTLNTIHTGLADLSQQTFSVDLGTLYEVGAAGMKIGMAIQNIGSQEKFIEREARIPSIFRVGTAATLLSNSSQKLVGSFEFSHPPDNSERVNIGAEYSFKKYMFLRGGYGFNYDAEGLGAGVGFHFPVSVAGMADFDYSYTDMLDLGAAHRFSLRFEF
jgi:long-subunit fatty acid transport protein